MRSLRCSPDGKFIVCGDQNGALKVYDTASAALLHSIEAHNGEITCIDFAQDSGQLLMASGSHDRLIHIFDCNAGFARKKTIEDQRSAVVSLAFAVDRTEQDPDKRIRLVTCGADKSIIFWYVARDFVCTKYHLEIDKQCKPLCLTTNQHTMQAIVGQERKISVWRIGTGKLARTFELKVEASARPINNISILSDPTASIIITSCSDKVIKARDFVNGKCVLRISNAGYTTSLALTPDCKRLLTASMEGCIMIWRLPEDLALHCQRKMLELNISAGIDSDVLPKASKDKMMAEWEGVAGLSPQEKQQKQQARAKQAKESSEMAMNAAAYVQNLLAKIKAPGAPKAATPEPLAKPADTKEESEKEEDPSQENSKYTIREQPKDGDGEPVEESNTEFEHEPSQEGRDVPVRLSRSLPPNRDPNASPEKNKPAELPIAKSPSVETVKESRKTVVQELPDKKPTPGQEETKEEAKEESKGEVEVAIDEDAGQGLDEEIDVLGQLLMRQRELADEAGEKPGPPPMMKQRESLTSKFWQEKLKVDEELKNAYQQAHKNPNKRDKSDLIFGPCASENVQTKLPNYKESAGTYGSMLKEMAVQQPSPVKPAPIEGKQLTTIKEESKTAVANATATAPEIKEKPAEPIVPSPAENRVEKLSPRPPLPESKSEPRHSPRAKTAIKETQTETVGVEEQVLEAMRRLVTELKEGKLSREAGQAFITGKVAP